MIDYLNFLYRLMHVLDNLAIPELFNGYKWPQKL